MYGRHPVLAALRNPLRRFRRLLTTAETASLMAAAAATAPVPRPNIEIVEPRVIASFVPHDAVHQGFAGLARPLPPTSLDSVLPDAQPSLDAVLVVLDQVTDPRNIGAVLRSAEAFAALAVVLQDRHAPPESGALAKAASGALEAVPLIRVTNLARSLRALKDAKFHCIGFAGESPLALAQIPLQGRLALVLGAEGAGLRRLVRETCDVIVRIPIAPAVDSLNVSAAASIALYECRREGSIASSSRESRRSSVGRATAL
jgi:23S rRNA (guanosine2251-2'-O)-methyltransferase